MNDRYYYIDGERYPRVSTILAVIDKPGLNIWRARVGLAEAERISAEARTFGTYVHTLCEQIARAYPEPVDLDADGDARLMAEGFATWLAANVRVVQACEYPVVSRRRRFAGQTDLIAVMHDGALAVLDWKTGNSLSETYAAQLAAYRLALREEGMPIVRRLVVHLPKRTPGVVRAISYPAHVRDERAFLACLHLYNWLHQRPTPAHSQLTLLKETP